LLGKFTLGYAICGEHPVSRLMFITREIRFLTGARRPLDCPRSFKPFMVVVRRKVGGH